MPAWSVYLLIDRSAARAGLEVRLVFKHKSHEQVQDERRPQGDKRGVNEVLADGARLDAKLTPPPLAYAKGLSFEKGYDAVHVLGLGCSPRYKKPNAPLCRMFSGKLCALQNIGHLCL